jgi:hypothetical protein
VGEGKFVEWTGQWEHVLGLLKVCTCVGDLGLVRGQQNTTQKTRGVAEAMGHLYFPLKSGGDKRLF